MGEKIKDKKKTRKKIEKQERGAQRVVVVHMTGCPDGVVRLG